MLDEVMQRLSVTFDSGIYYRDNQATSSKPPRQSSLEEDQYLAKGRRRACLAGFLHTTSRPVLLDGRLGQMQGPIALRDDSGGMAGTGLVGV